MPSGVVPALPRARAKGGEPGAGQWGTVEFQSTSGSWNVSTVSLTDPGADGFWAVLSSQTSNGYTYIPATSQHTTVAGVMGIEAHNGTGGWTTNMLSLLQRRGSATWPAGSVNINLTGSYISSSCVRFTYTEGFQRIVYGSKYSAHSSNVNNVTHTMSTNLGPYPGGVCIAGASHQSGAASGMTGISSASQDAGWIGGTYGGALSCIAYYILSTTEIETPPTCNFTTVYNNDCWISSNMYIR